MNDLIRSDAVSNKSHNDVNDDSFVTPQEQITCALQLVSTVVWAERDRDVAGLTTRQKVDWIKRYRTYSAVDGRNRRAAVCGRRCPPILEYNHRQDHTYRHVTFDARVNTLQPTTNWLNTYIVTVTLKSGLENCFVIRFKKLLKPQMSIFRLYIFCAFLCADYI